MIKRVARVIAAIALVAAFSYQPLETAQASTTSCGGISTIIAIFKDANYSGTCLAATGGNAAVGFHNMYESVATVVGAGCQNSPYADDFQDCASSFKFSASCHYEFTLYDNTDGTGILYSNWGSFNVASMPIGRNDNASAYRISYRSVCPNIAPQ